jgi:predicted GTPase
MTNHDENQPRRRVIILGAGGRDFHNFNTVYRDDPAYEVVAFTAAQIPDIDKRRYPAELSGELYPAGIPVYPQDGWEHLVRAQRIDEVNLAYSDLSHMEVMHIASRALAAGADFRLIGPRETMVPSTKPVVSICAVRTGCGKSALTRYVARIFRQQGLRIAAVRHPMPYGDLRKQAVQRFATMGDLTAADCTIEEREEYEPHIAAGSLVFAGVDYERILREAEKEADVILWDGGNNDFSFFKPDLEIAIADPHRPGHETAYYPGETNILRADVVVLAKVDTADPKSVQDVEASVRAVNPGAAIIQTAMPLSLDDPDVIRGRRVLVIEDGPTLTHGGMAYGAGTLAAKRFGAGELIDPRPYAVGSIRPVFDNFRHLGPVLPAMGYSEAQVRDLEATIRAVPADAVVVASPEDLRRLVKLDKPSVRVGYEVAEIGGNQLERLLIEFAGRIKVAA